MTLAELWAQQHLLAYKEIHRDPKARATPFEGTWPWPDPDAATPEEIAAAEARLLEISAFGPEHDR